MAEKKVSEAVSKLEEDGLSLPSCKKFINTYSKVQLLNFPSCKKFIYRTVRYNYCLPLVKKFINTYPTVRYNFCLPLVKKFINTYSKVHLLPPFSQEGNQCVQEGAQYVTTLFISFTRTTPTCWTLNTASVTY